MSSGTTVIELNKKKKKKKNMDKMGNIFCYNFGQHRYFKEIFDIQLSFDMCCAVKLWKVRIT